MSGGIYYLWLSLFCVLFIIIITGQVVFTDYAQERKLRGGGGGGGFTRREHMYLQMLFRNNFLSVSHFN